MKSYSIVCCLLLLTACGGESQASIPTPQPKPSAKRQAEGDAISLCDRWSDAAKRGDVGTALACFEQGRDFSFALNGHVIDEFEAFRTLTQRSYEGRKRLGLRRVAREVAVLGDQSGVVTGVDRFVITTHDDSEQVGQYAYGIVCRQRNGAWKIVHAYEMQKH